MTRSSCVLVLMALIACGGEPPTVVHDTPAASMTDVAAKKVQAVPAALAQPLVVKAPAVLPSVLPTQPAGEWASELCEPSALAWSGSSWIIADNETEKAVFQLGADWSVPPTKVKFPEGLEVGDAEALLAGGRIVVGSQTRRNSKGEEADATRLNILTRETGVVSKLTLALFDPAGPDGAARTEGKALQDMLEAAQKNLPPDSTDPHPTPFNVEGAAYAGEHVLFGLRGPLDAEGRAILLQAPKEPRDGVYTATAAVRLKLTTTEQPTPQGIREISPWRDGWLILGGTPYSKGHDDEKGTLWWWPSIDAQPTLLATVPASSEGVWAIDEGHVVLVIDGDKKAPPNEPQPPKGVCYHAGKWATLAVELP